MATNPRHRTTTASIISNTLRPTRQSSITSTSSVYSTATLSSMTRTSFEQVPESPLFDVKQIHTVPWETARILMDQADEKERSFTPTDVPGNRFTAGSSPTNLSDEPDSYSPPEELIGTPPSLEYRHSTRALISRYEAISGPRRTPPRTHAAVSPLRTPPVAPDLKRLNSPLPELPLLAKTKGQPSLSFRNLLTVFGKKSKSPKTAQSGTSTQTPNCHGGSVESLKTEDVFSLTSTHRKDRIGFLSASFTFFTGPALYLSSYTSPPTWHACSLSLHPSHLALTYAQGTRHITQTIPLQFCIDIVSLASHQLGSEVPIPSEGEAGDRELDQVAHVFEMTFEGCDPTKERLAALSVAERGRWVSATWDAILACRDPSSSRNDGRLSGSSSHSISRKPPPMAVDSTLPCLKPSPAPSQPAPPQLAPDPQRLMINEAEAQDIPSPTASLSAPGTPTRGHRLPPSKPSSAVSSLPSSPSMQTLDSMSIVRRRLAKLDTQHSLSSTDSLSRATSTRIRSCIVSSLKRRTTGAGHNERQEVHSHVSKPLERLEQNINEASRLSDCVPCPKTPFTALDAHAMYHQPRPIFFSTDIVEAKSIRHRGGRTSQTRGSTRESEMTQCLERSESWYGGLNGPDGLSELERADLETKITPGAWNDNERSIEDSGDRNPKTRAEGVEHLGRDVRSLVELFHAHAAQQSSQVSSLVDSLAPFHTKLDQIRQGMDGFDMGTMRHLLEDMASAPRSIGSIEHMRLLKKFDGLQTKGQPSQKLDLSPILAKLEELRTEMNGNLPRVLQKLDDLETLGSGHEDISPLLAKLEDIMVAMNEQRGSSDAPATSHRKSAAGPSVDLKDVHAKLDGLATVCATLMDRSKPFSAQLRGEVDTVMCNISHVKDSSKEECEYGPETFMMKLVDMLKSDQTNRILQAQQQADSVRYLNELNSWLENFVANSVGQMQQVAAGVDQLCREWLPVAETQTQVPAGSSGPTAKSKDIPGPKNIFASLHCILAEHEERSQGTRNLQATMHNLTEVLKEDMAKNAETRSEMVRHAQFQESLLNGLAAELTNEIRGERIRFVDAMKDATTVNVANHVEEFKKVLAKLHQEKKILEQQVAELFSFVAKQKQVTSATLNVPNPSRRPLPEVVSR